jgi:hypothetical protein
MSPADRSRLLQLARNDYIAIANSARIALRARVSLATNDYLRAVQGGCVKNPSVVAGLARSSRDLGAVADDEGLPEVLRLKAKVNQAQVEQCRLRAGESDSGRLDALLTELTGLPLPAEDVNGDAKRQIKALALSIRATRFAQTQRLKEAVSTLGIALDLDPRFERQALWLGLQSGWLLADCRIDEGVATQQRSLAQLRLAVQTSRVPPSDVEAYSAAFASDLSAAKQRCNGTKPTR